MEMVEYSCEGETVAILQEALNECDYEDAWAGEVDGIFGDDTYNALVLFQEYEEIEVDGIAGLDTWGCLGYDSGC